MTALRTFLGSAYVSLALVACGGASGAKPATVVANDVSNAAAPSATSSIVGQWVSVDGTEHLTYTDGRFEMRIERADGTDNCDINGPIVFQPSVEAPTRTQYSYDINTCNDDYQGKDTADTVLLNGDTLTVTDEEYGESTDYTRVR